MMMYNVVSEKDLKLRQGLKLIGLKDSVYWMSWYLILSFDKIINLLLRASCLQYRPRVPYELHF